ncbi:GNAT family N-acetyltransferase [Tannerella forsythia]
MSRKETYRTLCRTEESLPVFSRDWWLDAVCGEKRWDVLVIEEKGRVVATMPLYIPTGGVVSMPCYTQALGPWFAPLSHDTKYTTALGYRQALASQLTEQLKAYRSFFQNFSYEITDWLPFYWEGYTQTTRYTYLLKNIGETDRLLSRMSQNIRRNLIKAKEHHGITVKTGIPTEAFLTIQQKTFERQGTVNRQDPNVLKRLIEVCRQRGQGEIFGGYDNDGQLHAAAFIVWQKSSAYYIAGGGDPLLRHSGAHGLVLWEAIRHTAQYTDTFDFEGSMLRGVERFFREFGAIQTPYFTIYRGKRSWIDRIKIKWAQTR